MVWERFKRSVGSSSRTETVSTLRLMGGRQVEVVGESFHLASFERLFGPRGEPVRQEMVAILTPDPTNRYDPNAVKVTIEGFDCGVLARHAAAALAPILQAFAAEGVTTSVAAVVSGGWDRGNGDTGDFGVHLDLADPDDLQAQLQAIQH